MKKGRDLEAEYFSHENAEYKHKLDVEKERQEKISQEQELKKLHFMKCPKCGHDLFTKRLSYIDVDQCSSCGILVLAPEDIDKFIAEEKSVLKKFIDFFKP
jgi:hypothetical protein